MNLQGNGTTCFFLKQSHLCLFVVVSGGSSEQKSTVQCGDLWMEAIPMSRVSSVSVGYEIKGHSIWEGFCKNGIMTQRKKQENSSSFKAWWVSLALFHALNPGLSPCHQPNLRTPLLLHSGGPSQRPLLSSLSSVSHLLSSNSAWISLQEKYKRLRHTTGWRSIRSQNKSNRGL